MTSELFASSAAAASDIATAVYRIPIRTFLHSFGACPLPACWPLSVNSSDRSRHHSYVLPPGASQPPNGFPNGGPAFDVGTSGKPKGQGSTPTQTIDRQPSGTRVRAQRPPSIDCLTAAILRTPAPTRRRKIYVTPTFLESHFSRIPLFSTPTFLDSYSSRLPPRHKSKPHEPSLHRSLRPPTSSPNRDDTTETPGRRTT